MVNKSSSPGITSGWRGVVNNGLNALQACSSPFQPSAVSKLSKRMLTAFLGLSYISVCIWTANFRSLSTKLWYLMVKSCMCLGVHKYGWLRAEMDDLLLKCWSFGTWFQNSGLSPKQLEQLMCNDTLAFSLIAVRIHAHQKPSLCTHPSTYSMGTEVNIRSRNRTGKGTKSAHEQWSMLQSCNCCPNAINLEGILTNP